MEILKIREHGDMVYKVAEWFNSKWGVPVEAYEESVPQWYVVLENDVIIGGIGVIENDFHDRTDLTPNICALYVEKEHRDKGIAGNLLEYVCDDMSNFRSPRAIFTTQTILI